MYYWPVSGQLDWFELPFVEEVKEEELPLDEELTGKEWEGEGDGNDDIAYLSILRVEGHARSYSVCLFFFGSVIFWIHCSLA